MAAIGYHGNRWQVRIRRNGYPTETRSFPTRQDAERWARSVESAMDQGTFQCLSTANQTTLRDIILRYVKEVTPTMRSCREDTIRLKAVARQSIGQLSMANLSAAHIASYRDQRLKAVSAGTVIRELAYLSSIINHARREWSINMVNPVQSIRKPPSPLGRSRILTQEERGTLLSALEPKGRRSPWMHPLVALALETAMRRGELLSLRWEHVRLNERTARLSMTKNGDARVVPLSSAAVEILRGLPQDASGQVFPVQAPAVHAAFKRAVVRSGLKDLRFHDLRHSAITIMATKLPNVIELSAVSGHKSLAMLKRYYHPQAEALALKLG